MDRIRASFDKYKSSHENNFPLRGRGIPKSSRTNLPDLRFSCSFFLCQDIENATVLRNKNKLAKTGKVEENCATHYRKKCPNFKHEFQIQAVYLIFCELRITNPLDFQYLFFARKVNLFRTECIKFFH